MVYEKLQHFCCLIKRCLYLGKDISIIEESICQLGKMETRALQEFFDRYQPALGPLLFWHLKQKGLTSLLKPDIAAFLKTRYSRNLSRNCLLEGKLVQILEGFHGADIRVLLLKGTCAFASSLSFLRDAYTPFDLDLFVRSSDLERAKAILIGKGYRLTNQQYLQDWTKQSFLNADGSAPVDLHTGLFWRAPGGSTNYFDYRNSDISDIWECAIPDSVEGCRVWLPSQTDQICYRLVHDVVGHGEELRLLASISRLYHFSFLLQLYDQTIEWRQLVDGLRAKRMDRLLLAYICYGNREFGLPVPLQLRPWLSKDLGLFYLDAIVRCPLRLRNANYRTSVVMLTAHSVLERLQIAYQIMIGLAMGRRRMESSIVLVKVILLQLLSVLYVLGQKFRRRDVRGREYA